MLRLALVPALVAWLAAPWIAMWRHGTLDQQHWRNHDG